MASRPPTQGATKLIDTDERVDEDVEMEDRPEEADSEEDGEAEMYDDSGHDMYRTIHNLSTYLCTVEEDGEEIAAGFQRIPNRRVLPDYFEVISEPIAFSTIRMKTQRKQYSSFSDFVKDVAQICHNAQVYNRPSAPIFHAAVRLRELFQAKLKDLVAKGDVRPDEAMLPDLGELPPIEESPLAPSDAEDDEDDEEEEEDDEDEEEEEDDDSDDDGRPRRRRPGKARPSGSGRHNGADKEEDAHKKRGRPPSVLTPLEARISNILRGLRKPKDEDGNLLILPFEKLPDKTLVTDYYQTISNPIALDNIKKKAKRKKYQNVDHLMADINLMFENAKHYNEDDSAVFRAAVELQKQAIETAEQENMKPDDDFRDEDGKLPLDEIHHNGDTWRVGDWVQIRNPNDLGKPIIAQIYRTWQDRDGQRWINACWYYRPEQTVHRFDKHFFDYEVVKTGQYRDHLIEDVLDRCFVMFVTRFGRGRPRGLPREKEVYVCESRYNEEKFRFNKIKTWASCVPDEVRDKDYVMDLFDSPQPMPKRPSPIKHLLRHDAKETDELPKPTWGSPNAPPIVGAVHRRPREYNESPPRELTQPPPPPPMQASFDATIDAARQSSFLSTNRDISADANIRNSPTTFPLGAPSPSPGQYHVHLNHQFQPAPPGSSNSSITQTPVPVPQPPHQNAASQVPMRPMHYQQQGYPQGSPANYAQSPAMHINNPPQNIPVNQGQPHGPPRTTMVPPGSNPSQPNAYNPPRPPEVYILPDNVNEALVPELRRQFHHDARGRVLFFTAPPLDRSSHGLSPASAGLGHSAKYLAGREQWLAERSRKRKERDVEGGKERERRILMDKAIPPNIEGMPSQAADVLGEYFRRFNAETGKWEKEAGLEGWRDTSYA